MMEKLDIKQLNRKFANEHPKEIIEFAMKQWGQKNTVLASSMSIEDQVLTDLIIRQNPLARIFFIDTGRHFEETYQLLEETMHKYSLKYEVYVPQSQRLETILSDYGPNFFYDSVEARKKCCHIRKVEPLKRVLSTADAWICGLRKSQSLTRENINVFEWDATHKMYKVNPLAHWSEEAVWEYIHDRQVPYNQLYTKNFPSIGCRPCTRAVEPEEDVRSGRWWWEELEKKECGLHIRMEES